MRGVNPLPLRWLLSDARNDAGLEASIAALPAGSGFVFRHYHLTESDRRARFATLAALARDHGHLVAIARPSGDLGSWKADGTYGAAPRGHGLHLAAAHDADEIQAAIAAGADGIFLSPVFPTASHPGARTLGVRRFRALAMQSPIPVIALGGMTPARARELDWPRWGAIDGLAAPRRI
ncbi:MAG: thiamine phosphate synthase [Erythrobacter sp.]|nr:thiamine phosphate synthase [Erythrobacter sp.]